MSVTALFATTGATNAGLYPAPGIGDHLAGPAVPAVHGPAPRRTGVGQPADRRGRRRSWSSPCSTCRRSRRSGAPSRCSSSRSITAGHLRIRAKTGANVWILLARGRHRRRQPRDVRLHVADRRAGVHRDARPDRRAQPRPGPGLGPRRDPRRRRRPRPPDAGPAADRTREPDGRLGGWTHPASVEASRGTQRGCNPRGRPAEPADGPAEPTMDAGRSWPADRSCPRSMARTEVQP